MANPLDWLLQSVAPPQSPIKYDDGQPSLTAYYPKPSERFERWVHSLLGGGPSASLPHENFARGVPKLLEMTPLGIGLSAADLIRAKADRDPLGAAAAAIGMLPGAGRLAPEAKAIGKSSADATEAALKAIEEILGPTPVHAPGPGTPYLMGGPANPANSPINVAKQTGLLNNIPQEQNWDKYFELQNAALQKITPKGQVTHAYNPVTGMWEVFDPHGPANAFVMSQHQSMAEAASAAAKLNTKNIPAGWEPMPPQTATSADWLLHPDDFKFENGQWLQKVGLPNTKKAGQVPEAAAPAAKPIYDYEKDDNGLYHIFDAVSGKTVKVVDTPNQAKAWMASEDAKAKLPSTSMPIKVASSGETTFENLGAFPKSVPFQPPPQAIEHGYVTPAVHGTKVSTDWWKTPESNIIVGGPQDALRLPSEELGVHFGTPDQARQFTGNIVGGGYTPRTYPTVLQTGRSLELPDMGTWHVSRIKEALERLNKGTGYGVSHGTYTVKDAAAHMGLFPQEELDKIDNIQQMRDYLNKKGFNSVNYINSVESPGHTSHIMFNPSPEAPDFVAGVRSPFAAFDPSKAMRPELAYSIGALLGIPALMPKEEKQ